MKYEELSKEQKSRIARANMALVRKNLSEADFGGVEANANLEGAVRAVPLPHFGVASWMLLDKFFARIKGSQTWEILDKYADIVIDEGYVIPSSLKMAQALSAQKELLAMKEKKKNGTK